MLLLPDPTGNELLPDQLAQEYFAQSDSIIKKAKATNRQLHPYEAKQLKDLTNAIRQLNTNFNPPVMMTVFARLNEFIAPLDHPFVCQLMDFERAYLKEKFNLGKDNTDE